MVYDVLILGGGASGLMCALTAIERGLSVCVVDANDYPGRKMGVCGGGYGNFANMKLDPKRDYYSHNPYFILSALKRYPVSKVIEWVESFGLGWEVREEQYCFGTSPFGDFITTVAKAVESAGGVFEFGTRIVSAAQTEGIFKLTASDDRTFEGRQLVVATGGCSYPQLGATPFGLKVAKGFKHAVTPVKPGLAPIRFSASELAITGELAGISLETVTLRTTAESFTGSLVFRPDGIGGIAVFKAASSWAWYGGEMSIDWSPEFNITQWVTEGRTDHGTQTVKNRIAQKFPKRLVLALLSPYAWADKPLAQLKKSELDELESVFHQWRFIPSGTGDFNEAEVMLGGVETESLSSKTMESQKIPGLYFIGEVLDVTGQLGGFNLHWAFASGHAAGEALKKG